MRKKKKLNPAGLAFSRASQLTTLLTEVFYQRWYRDYAPLELSYPSLDQLNEDLRRYCEDVSTLSNAERQEYVQALLQKVAVALQDFNLPEYIRQDQSILVALKNTLQKELKTLENNKRRLKPFRSSEADEDKTKGIVRPKLESIDIFLDIEEHASVEASVFKSFKNANKTLQSREKIRDYAKLIHNTTQTLARAEKAIKDYLKHVKGVVVDEMSSPISMNQVSEALRGHKKVYSSILALGIIEQFRERHGADGLKNTDDIEDYEAVISALHGVLERNNQQRAYWSNRFTDGFFHDAVRYDGLSTALGNKPASLFENRATFSLSLGQKLAAFEREQYQLQQQHRSFLFRDRSGKNIRSVLTATATSKAAFSSGISKLADRVDRAIRLALDDINSAQTVENIMRASDLLEDRVKHSCKEAAGVNDFMLAHWEAIVDKKVSQLRPIFRDRAIILLAEKIDSIVNEFLDETKDSIPKTFSIVRDDFIQRVNALDLREEELLLTFDQIQEVIDLSLQTLEEQYPNAHEEYLKDCPIRELPKALDHVIGRMKQQYPNDGVSETIKNFVSIALERAWDDAAVEILTELDLPVECRDQRENLLDLMALEPVSIVSNWAENCLAQGIAELPRGKNKKGRENKEITLYLNRKKLGKNDVGLDFHEKLGDHLYEQIKKRVSEMKADRFNEAVKFLDKPFNKEIISEMLKGWVTQHFLEKDYIDTNANGTSIKDFLSKFKFGVEKVGPVVHQKLVNWLIHKVEDYADEIESTSEAKIEEIEAEFLNYRVEDNDPLLIDVCADTLIEQGPALCWDKILSEYVDPQVQNLKESLKSEYGAGVLSALEKNKVIGGLEGRLPVWIYNQVKVRAKEEIWDKKTIFEKAYYYLPTLPTPAKALIRSIAFADGLVRGTARVLRKHSASSADTPADKQPASVSQNRHGLFAADQAKRPVSPVAFESDAESDATSETSENSNSEDTIPNRTPAIGAGIIPH